MFILCSSFFQSVITLDGNTLTHKQQIGKLSATTTRVFTPTEMKVTFTSGGVTAIRVFKKVSCTF